MDGVVGSRTWKARTLKREDYVKFAADVRRLRLLGVVVLAIGVTVPSVIEMFRQDLSPVTVLFRLVLSLIVIGALVWILSGVVLHYARVQVIARERVDDRGNG